LTPIQHWFFDQDMQTKHHYNQSVLLPAAQRLDRQALRQAVQSLIRHHDALRMRFQRVDGQWRQSNGGLDPNEVYTCVDFSELPEAQRSGAQERIAEATQKSLNLERGQLLRVVEIDHGKLSRLLMVIHHLVVDGVSWRILLEDLQLAYGQLRRGEPIDLPRKTTSFQQWAEGLVAYVKSEGLGQREYWEAVAEQWPRERLPRDWPEGSNTVGSVETVGVRLTEEETEALLRKAPKAYRSRIQELLVAALAEALRRWSGSDVLLLEIEGHGREEIMGEVDVSRTVGWFTSIYPVVLKATDGSWRERINAVKERLEKAPERGTGYGLLRYLSDEEEIISRLRALPPAEVMFNYLGQFDQALEESEMLTPLQESSGWELSPREKRAHLLEVVGRVSGGQLCMDLRYSREVHRAEKMEALAQNFLECLRDLIEQRESVKVDALTPADFPLARLDQQQLHSVMRQIREQQKVRQ
jgi:non-ribosomal peptide synthase protein (TIGR01720 family)